MITEEVVKAVVGNRYNRYLIMQDLFRYYGDRLLDQHSIVIITN